MADKRLYCKYSTCPFNILHCHVPNELIYNTTTRSELCDKVSVDPALEIVGMLFIGLIDQLREDLWEDCRNALFERG